MVAEAKEGSLSSKERELHRRGRVLIDKDLHEQIDQAVMQAYVWPGTLEKAKAEASVLLRPRQPDQEIGDLLVLVVQLGAVTIAGLADTKGAAGECNAHPAQRHRFPGHPLADRQMLAFAVRLPALRWPGHFFPRAL